MKLSKRDSLLLVILAVVAGVGGFYWFYVKPAKAELATKQDEVAAAETEVSGLRDTLARLEKDAAELSAGTADRLRIAKAVPMAREVPGAIYQIQRLAERANVEFNSIEPQDDKPLGGITGHEFIVKVQGRFFDVDDFLYRMHRLVSVNAKGRPAIKGRLYAVTKVEIERVNEGGAADADKKANDDVEAAINVVTFSASGDGAPAAAATDGSAPIASPAVGQAAATPTGGTP